MENMTMNNVAMAALLNETLPALASPTVHGISTIIRVLILSILGISFALLILVGIVHCCVHCSEYNRMGRISQCMVLLGALVALVVGVKAIIWLVHLCGAIHVPVWLVNSWYSATAWVLHAWTSSETSVLFVLGISLALLILLYCGLPWIGFVEYGIAPLSYAARWMSSIGNVVAGSLFSLLQSIAAGGISFFMVLLCIVVFVALAVGAFEIISWLIHSVAIHVPTWLVDSWDSATAWVLHAWDSVEMLGWWNSAVAWLHHLWESITDHHKWKIYT